MKIGFILLFCIVVFMTFQQTEAGRDIHDTMSRAFGMNLRSKRNARVSELRVVVRKGKRRFLVDCDNFCKRNEEGGFTKTCFRYKYRYLCAFCRYRFRCTQSNQIFQ